MTKAILPYDVERGGQVIQKLDLTVFQNKHQNALNKYVSAKVLEIQEDYNKLLNLYKWNEYVMQFKVNFEPIVGKTYYLYEASSLFVSLLAPQELTTCKCLGSTKLIAEGYWIKIEE